MSDFRKPAEGRRIVDEACKLSSSLTLYRAAVGEVLDACLELSELEYEYPSLETRPKWSVNSFGIQLLARKEVRRNKQKIGDVSLRGGRKVNF